MAVLVAVSFSLPSNLWAAHCDMDKHQGLKTETTGDDCSLMEVHSAHLGHDHQNEDCDLKLSCACELEHQQVTAEAISAITKTTKSFVVSVTRFINLVPIDTPIFFTDTKFSSHTEFPPIFLLNSVFLN